MRPLERPWGGGNAWLTQVVRHLGASGYDVRFDLNRPVDAIVVVDPRVRGNVGFGATEIAAFREQHPEARCLHRINEGDLHRGTNEIDALLAEANRVADHTVFISGWVRDYHAERWFDRARPHTVIHNGADPAVFHPIGAARFEADGVLRLVTHHWSDNPRKGFDVYQEVDRAVAAGELDGVELWVIGRWPREAEWRSAQTFEPVSGRRLADLLRSCHVYLTASRFEPGGMHHVEGAQCGLPVLYHTAGGAIAEMASRYGIGYDEDVRSAIAAVRERYGELKREVLECAPSGDEMCARYRSVIQRLLA